MNIIFIKPAGKSLTGSSKRHKNTLDEIRTINGETTLCFAGGTYDFFSTSASTAHNPVTAVHKQWDFVTPFHLNGLEGLIFFSGNGQKLRIRELYDEVCTPQPDPVKN